MKTPPSQNIKALYRRCYLKQKPWYFFEQDKFPFQTIPKKTTHGVPNHFLSKFPPCSHGVSHHFLGVAHNHRRLEIVADARAPRGSSSLGSYKGVALSGCLLHHLEGKFIGSPLKGDWDLRCNYTGLIKGRFYFWTAGSIQNLAFIPIGCTSNVAAMGSHSSGWVVGRSTWMRELLFFGRSRFLDLDLRLATMLGKNENIFSQMLGFMVSYHGRISKKTPEKQTHVNWWYM